jgi:hypothetical protein
VTVDPATKKVIAPSTFPSTLANVEKALALSDAKPSELASVFFTLFVESSPYNYEVLRFLVDKLQEGGPPMVRTEDDRAMLTRAEKALGFLQQYERAAEPDDHERDLWVKHRPGRFPAALARQRLPLNWLVQLPGKEKFKLLKKEFNLSTFSLWTRLAPSLKLAPDHICIQAVQNEVAAIAEKGKRRESPEKDDEETEWNLNSMHGALLKKLHGELII